MINLKINNIPIQVSEGTTVLEAATANGIHIPTLCHLKEINEIGACRICLVEVKGARSLQTACVLPVSEGMEVTTNSKNVLDARRFVLELILSDHNRECLTCVRNQTCELQSLCEEFGIDQIRFEGEKNHYEVDDLSPSIVRDNSKCVLCRRCVAACSDVQNIHAITAVGRGKATEIGSSFGKSLSEVNCVNCGQCIVACPVGALREKDGIDKVWEAIAAGKKVVYQPAPAVRAALGEPFGMPMGISVTGKMAAALRRLDAYKVFDVDFAADLTIMEEGTELLGRIQNGGVLPMITSCSPGWIKYAEHNYHDLLPNLSSCKSPHEMGGAMVKTYFAEKEGIDPKELFVVSIMPCTAKKFEAERGEHMKDGVPYVDVVLTTRELARMIKSAGIDFINLPDEEFDSILGESSGAGVIFGATGGVMEAALRTVADKLSGQSLESIDYADVRGTEGIKEASVKIGDLTVNVAVAHGTGSAKKLLDKVREGGTNYHFIEIMGCPGGCVTGGGQPHVAAKIRRTVDPKVVRAKSLYQEDAGKPIRKSHENPEIAKIYNEYLGEPGGHKAHELLHTHYQERARV